MDYIHILNDFKSRYIMIKIPQDSCNEISWLTYMIDVEISFTRHNSCKDVIYINMICILYKEIYMFHTRLSCIDLCSDIIKPTRFFQRHDQMYIRFGQSHS